MLRKYWYKLLAPVVITILLLAGLCLYAATCFGITVTMLAFQGPVWLGVAFCLVCLGGCGVSIYVLWERIKEIESGEEDDLSQY